MKNLDKEQASGLYIHPIPTYPQCKSPIIKEHNEFINNRKIGECLDIECEYQKPLKLISLCGEHFFCEKHNKQDLCPNCKCTDCNSLGARVFICGHKYCKNHSPCKNCCVFCRKPATNILKGCNHNVCAQCLSVNSLCPCKKCDICKLNLPKRRACTHNICGTCEINLECPKCNEDTCRSCNTRKYISTSKCLHGQCLTCIKTGIKSDCDCKNCEICGKNESMNLCQCGSFFCTDCDINSLCLNCYEKPCESCRVPKTRKSFDESYHFICEMCSNSKICRICSKVEDSVDSSKSDSIVQTFEYTIKKVVETISIEFQRKEHSWKSEKKILILRYNQQKRFYNEITSKFNLVKKNLELLNQTEKKCAEEFQKEINQLNAKINSLQHQKMQEVEKNFRSSAEISFLKSKILELNKSLEEKSQENSNLNQNIKRLESKISTLSEKESKLNKNIGSLKSQVSELEKRLNDQIQKNSNLVSHITQINNLTEKQYQLKLIYENNPTK
jgi:peptidoglycan hydrolase CwlO-like protein